MDALVVVVVIAILVALGFLVAATSSGESKPRQKSLKQLERELALHDRLVNSTTPGTPEWIKRVKDRSELNDEWLRRGGLENRYRDES